MDSMIDIVYRLRLLQEKLESGQGLNMEEIVDLERLESELRTPLFGRQYRRAEVGVSALLRYPGKDSVVQVADISPGGMRVTGCPDLERGHNVTLQIRKSQEATYRFPAQVMWVRSSAKERMAGLRLVGHPVLINHGPEAPCKEDSRLGTRVA